ILGITVPSQDSRPGAKVILGDDRHVPGAVLATTAGPELALYTRSNRLDYTTETELTKRRPL
ncbi:MAG TPA: hypothetical protein VFR55_00635, partial [Dehalococcoidia bacterium]|nr:hypothetical protein [Dehalococcoidia bacterium]